MLLLNERVKKIIRNSLWYALLITISLYTIVIFYLNITALDNNINSEIAFEIIFSRQIRREHTLFPIRFFYGYELSALRPAFLAAIIDRVIHNAILAYGWALNITLIILIASWIYLLKGLKMNKIEMGVAILAWIAVPAYMNNAYVQYLYNGYFGFYTIVILLGLGGYVRLKNITLRQESILICVLGIPTFIFGLMGVRMLQMIYMPMVLYEILRIGINIWQKNKIKSRIKEIIFTTSLFLINLLGFIIFSLRLSNKFVFNMIPSEVVFRTVEGLHDSILATMNELIRAMGAYFGSPVISLKGMLYLATLVISVIIVIVALRVIQSGYISDVPCIVCISILITFTICSLTWFKVMSRYFMMYAILLATIGGIIEKYLKEKEQKFFRNFIGICLIIVALGNLVTTYIPMIRERNNTLGLEEVITCLEENDIRYCYGMGVGLEISSLTNFEVDSAFVFYDEEHDKIIFGDMGSYDNFDTIHQGEKSALLVPNDYYEQYSVKWSQYKYMDDAVELVDFKDYKLYLFDYNPFADVENVSMKE